MFTKTQKDDHAGYRLYDFGSHYELHYGKGVYSGTLKQVTTYAVIELGFEVSEIEVGVIEMVKHAHDAAEFGIYKRFIFTFKREDKNESGTVH